MTRWQELVDNLLTDLETETPGADDFRVKVDYKIWKAEQKVSKTSATTPYETTVRRLHGFQRELIETLSKQLKNDPANEILLEARSLLENPWLRVPEHQRPDLR
jgi:acyl-CoA-binding protein